MAEVFIKGLKMPKSCSVCQIADWEYDCCPVADRKNIIMTDTSGRPDFCPLVEVPDHGDLIERGEVADIVNKWMVKNLYAHPYTSNKTIPTAEMFDILMLAKTVIPADKGEV